eukprot:SAG11_NODE_627_length_8087_cov_3.567852_7_plen_162_part_00
MSIPLSGTETDPLMPTTPKAEMMTGIDGQLRLLVDMFNGQISEEDLTADMLEMVQSFGLLDGQMPADLNRRSQLLEIYLADIGCQVGRFQRRKGMEANMGSWKLYFANCVDDAQIRLSTEQAVSRTASPVQIKSRTMAMSPPPSSIKLCVDRSGHPHFRLP